MSSKGLFAAINRLKISDWIMFSVLEFLIQLKKFVAREFGEVFASVCFSCVNISHEGTVYCLNDLHCKMIQK